MDSSKHSVLKIEPLNEVASTVETVFPSSAGFVATGKTIYRSDKIYPDKPVSITVPVSVNPTLNTSNTPAVLPPSIPIMPPTIPFHITQAAPPTTPAINQLPVIAVSKEKKEESIEPIERPKNNQTVETIFDIDRSVSRQDISTDRKIKVVKSVSLSKSSNAVYTVENQDNLIEVCNKCKNGDHLILMTGIYPLLTVKGGISYSGVGQVLIQNLNVVNSKEQIKISNLHFNIEKSPINCQSPILFTDCKFNFVGSATPGSLSALQTVENLEISNCSFYLNYGIPQSNITMISIHNNTCSFSNNKIEIKNGNKSNIEVFKLLSKKSNLIVNNNIFQFLDKGSSKLMLVGGTQAAGYVFISGNIATGNNGDNKNKSTIGISSIPCYEQSNILKMLPDTNWNYLKSAIPGKKVRVLKSNTQILEDDYKLIINSSSPLTITLPTSRGVPDNNSSFYGQELKILNMNQEVTHEIVAPNGNLINGKSKYSFHGKIVEVNSWGQNWFVFNS